MAKYIVNKITEKVIEENQSLKKQNKLTWKCNCYSCGTESEIYLVEIDLKLMIVCEVCLNKNYGIAPQKT